MQLYEVNEYLTPLWVCISTSLLKFPFKFFSFLHTLRTNELPFHMTAFKLYLYANIFNIYLHGLKLFQAQGKEVYELLIFCLQFETFCIIIQSIFDF